MREPVQWTRFDIDLFRIVGMEATLFLSWYRIDTVHSLIDFGEFPEKVPNMAY